MHLIVTARELNLPGRKPLYKGDHFEIDEMAGKTLKLIGKAEDPRSPAMTPVGHVATTRALSAEAEAVGPDTAEFEEIEPEAPATELDPEPKDRPKTYRNRRLKTED